ncbi:MAG: hypothetical protein KJ941_05340 [Bacteroidetes bacterium]|nr:hypothetical protein [Bacteroidota bacterium]
MKKYCLTALLVCLALFSTSQDFETRKGQNLLSSKPEKSKISFTAKPIGYMKRNLLFGGSISFTDDKNKNNLFLDVETNYPEKSFDHPGRYTDADYISKGLDRNFFHSYTLSYKRILKFKEIENFVFVKQRLIYGPNNAERNSVVTQTKKSLRVGLSWFDYTFDHEIPNMFYPENPFFQKQYNNGIEYFKMRNTTGVVNIGWEKSIKINSKVKGNKGPARTINRERNFYTDLMISPYSKFYEIEKLVGNNYLSVYNRGSLSNYYQNKIREYFIFIPFGVKVGIQQTGFLKLPVVLKAETGFLPSIVLKESDQLTTGGFISLSIAYQFFHVKLK